MTPHDLAAWAERAKPDEQRAVLDAAWRMLRGDEYTRTGVNKYYDFTAMLDAEAWESAALMLVPEGYSHWNVGGRYQDYGAQVVVGIQEYFGQASTPALALIAAIARVQIPT